MNTQTILPVANRLGAQLSLILLLGVLGFQLSQLTWNWLLPEKTVWTGLIQPALPEDEVEQTTVSSIPLSTVTKSLAVFDPWGKIPVISPPPKVTPKIEEKVVETVLNVELLGTLIRSSGDSVAIMVEKRGKGRRKGNQGQQFLQVGDKIQTALLERIERKMVYLRNGKQLEVVRMSSELGDPQVSVSEKSKQINSAKKISRKEYLALLDQGVKLLRGVKITPYYRGKHSVGYRLQMDNPREIFTRMGIKSGDVIQKVNGNSVVGSGAITKLVTQLRREKQIRVDLLRNNSPGTLVVDVQ